MADDANLPAPSDNAGLRAVAGQIQIGGSGIAPKTMAELMDFAQLMAKGGPMVGKAFRGNPGACLGICMVAMRWRMDPFAVSQKAYVTGENIAYEAQLVTAVINANAPIVERPRYEFSGEGPKRRCKITATLKGDSQPSEYLSPETGKISPKNSPLWKTDEDQQLGYVSIRAWARRYCPEIIMGVYSVDEMQDAVPVAVERSSPIPMSETETASTETIGTTYTTQNDDASDEPGMFLSGEAKDFVVDNYTELLRACNSEDAIKKVWARFTRIYHNGKSQKVSRNTYDGLEFILNQEEMRIANQNLDLGRTSEAIDGEAEIEG